MRRFVPTGNDSAFQDKRKNCEILNQHIAYSQHTIYYEDRMADLLATEPQDRRQRLGHVVFRHVLYTKLRSYLSVNRLF